MGIFYTSAGKRVLKQTNKVCINMWISNEWWTSPTLPLPRASCTNLLFFYPNSNLEMGSRGFTYTLIPGEQCESTAWVAQSSNQLMAQQQWPHVIFKACKSLVPLMAPSTSAGIPRGFLLSLGPTLGTRVLLWIHWKLLSFTHKKIHWMNYLLQC